MDFFVIAIAHFIGIQSCYAINTLLEMFTVEFIESTIAIVILNLQ